MIDLYNRIRPRKFSDMLNTCPKLFDNIEQLIANHLSGLPGPNHVMIFHSDSIYGLGKTTAARIFTSELNPHITDDIREELFSGLDCIVCTEVNATDMDKKDIKALVKTMFDCSNDLYGYNYVYIINEAHKLTTDSMQVLLSIENLPKNVFVILTTTEALALRGDLLSRATVFNFKPVSVDEMAQFLKKVAKEYGADYVYSASLIDPIPDSIFKSIATSAIGSFRSALLMLQTYMNTGVYENTLQVGEQDNSAQYYLFTEYIKLWFKVPQRLTNWGAIMNKYIEIMGKKDNKIYINADDFRKSLLYRIQWVITSKESLTEGLQYSDAKVCTILYKHIKDPLSYPADTQLVLRLYNAYVEIVETFVNNF